MTEVPQIPAFSPDDLVQAILLIDAGADQGAFHGWEQVHRAIAVRSRLLLFAQHWQGTIDAQKAAQDAANNQQGADQAPAPAQKGDKK